MSLHAGYLKESRLTQMSNAEMVGGEGVSWVVGGGCVGEFLCLCWWVLFCIGSSTHWDIQINVAAFNFSLFLSLSFTLRLFNFPWSFFSVASVHPVDRCTIGALKLRNVYIIHITPQKVLIKLYVANGVGSRGLKMLPASQMSQRIDRERREPCWGFDSRVALI